MRQYPSHNYRLIPNFWNSKLTHQIICYRTRECFKSAWTWCRPFRECQCEALKSDPSKRLIKPVIITWGIFVLGARLGLAATVLQYNSATHVVDYKTVVYFLHKVHEESPLQKLGLVLPCGPHCTSTMTWAVDWQGISRQTIVFFLLSLTVLLIITGLVSYNFHILSTSNSYYRKFQVSSLMIFFEEFW